MKKAKILFFFLPILVVAASFRALGHHPLSMFVLRGSGGLVEAFVIKAPLNGGSPVVDAAPLTPAQKKEGMEILGQKDEKLLRDFSKNFGTYAAVIGMPTTEEGWPEYLGGGFKGIEGGGRPESFDDLQWTDRLYLAFALKVPPPAPFLPEKAIPAVSSSPVSNVPVTSSASAPHPASTPSVVRVEILNGCGITNAADWAARRIKGPGIIITDTGNADNFHYPKTIIRTSAGVPVALGEAVERLGLSKDSIEETPNPSPSVDVVVIVGRDYTKLRERFRERNRH